MGAGAWFLGAAGFVAGTGAAVAVGASKARRVRRELDIRYRRTEAWLAIYSVIRPRVPFPAVRGYMASPEFLRCLVQVTLDERPALVVELGSGLSTVLLAYCLERLGRGRLVSVDADARFCGSTRALLARHGLADHVRLVCAPLVPVGPEAPGSRWYDRAALAEALAAEGRPIDLLIVDGPPGNDQPMARHPAVPVLGAHFAREVTILVDDASRKDESDMVRRWVTTDPDFSCETWDTETGTAVLRRRQPPPPPRA